jgi:antitoxin HigA-1
MKSNLTTIHPGEFLGEILGELKISQAAFARTAGVSPVLVSYLIRGSRSVSAALALRFSKVLGQSPEYWLNLQTAYDLATAHKALRPKLAGLRRLRQAE